MSVLFVPYLEYLHLKEFMQVKSLHLQKGITISKNIPFKSKKTISKYNELTLNLAFSSSEITTEIKAAHAP